MFTLAIFLVAVLNYYAMVREPDIVEMEDLIEYKNEVVKVEGEIIRGGKTHGIPAIGRHT